MPVWGNDPCGLPPPPLATPGNGQPLSFGLYPGPLSSTDRRILDFAVQVTQVSSALTKNDVEQLRDAGLEESQILDVVLIACLSNFMDRLANSLGVDLEPRHRRALENWQLGRRRSKTG